MRVANEAARPFAEVRRRRNDQGFTFETRAIARKALRAAKQAVIEFREGKPWPDWARQAVANGWKAPRG